MTREKLKQFTKDLYKEKIYLVFYDEINRAKDGFDDFGLLLERNDLSAQVRSARYSTQHL
jgi:hypothetical protein